MEGLAVFAVENGSGMGKGGGGGGRNRKVAG